MIKSRRMGWAGHVARGGEKRNVYKIFVEKSGGNRPLGRPRHRWLDNVKMEFIDIGYGGMGWIDLFQDRDQWMVLMNTAMNLRVQ
jgi:hypothetical protein